MRRELDGMHDELVKQDEENMSLKLALGKFQRLIAPNMTNMRQNSELHYHFYRSRCKRLSKPPY